MGDWRGVGIIPECSSIDGIGGRRGRRKGVRLSWSLGDRRGRPGTEKLGMILMYLM